MVIICNKPQAKVFKKWVTSEVLPSIRKTGAFNNYIPANLDEAHWILHDKSIELLERCNDLFSKTIEDVSKKLNSLTSIPTDRILPTFDGSYMIIIKDDMGNVTGAYKTTQMMAEYVDMSIKYGSIYHIQHTLEKLKKVRDMVE